MWKKQLKQKGAAECHGPDYMSYSCMIYEGTAICVSIQSLWLKVELCFNIKPLTYLHYSIPVVSPGTLHEILHRPLCHGRMYACISAYAFLFLFPATSYLEKRLIKGVCEYEHLYDSVTALQRLMDGHKFMERNVKKLQSGLCRVHELMAQTCGHLAMCNYKSSQLL